MILSIILCLTMKINLGHQATRGEQLLYELLLSNHPLCINAVIIIHHVTDSVRKLQLDVECRRYDGTFNFERIIL